MQSTNDIGLQARMTPLSVVALQNYWARKAKLKQSRVTYDTGLTWNHLVIKVSFQLPPSLTEES